MIGIRSVLGLHLACCAVTVVAVVVMLVGLVSGGVGGPGLGLGLVLVGCLLGSRSGLAGVREIVEV